MTRAGISYKINQIKNKNVKIIESTYLQYTKDITKNYFFKLY